MINFTEKRIKTFVEAMRPPVEYRDELDIGYQFEKNSLEIFEIRPQWNNRKNILHLPFAKARYIKNKEIWKLYWMRGNGKWESYQPNPEVTSIDEVFQIIDEDEYHCFKG